MELDGEMVLSESVSKTLTWKKVESTWRVATEVPTDSKGIMYRHVNGERVKAKGSLVPWGTLINGVQIDENHVKVGEYYLPIRLEKLQQVLWPQSMVPAQFSSSTSSGSQVVRIHLLVSEPKGEYRLTGTVAGGWESHLVLKSEAVSSSLAAILKQKQSHYVDVPISELNNAEFKFQCHEKEGLWNQFRNVFYDVLHWEYDGVDNNRTVKSGFDVPDLYMSYGTPEPSQDDVVDFMKLALSGASLQDMSLAILKVNEVKQSVLHVSCKQATRAPEDIFIKRCLQRALSDVLIGSIQPKPCGGLYMWMAVLEQEINGNLRGLNPLVIGELLALISVWPLDVMSHVVLEDHIHEAAKSAVLREARSASRLSKQWLQAAIQVVVNGVTSDEEVIELKQHAVRVGDELPEWDAVRLQHVPFANIESALRVALGPARMPVKVWCAAKHFLEHIDRPELGQVCACVALDEALTYSHTYYFMDFQDIVFGLDCLLEKLVEGSFDARLQQDLTTLIQEYLPSQPRWKVVLPAQPYTGKALGILARALTADPSRACQVTFQDETEFVWLRLAAEVQCEECVLG